MYFTCKSFEIKIYLIFCIKILSKNRKFNKFILILRSRLASKKPIWEDNLDYGPWYKPDAYEIPFEKIEIMQKIGTGHFGEVRVFVIKITILCKFLYFNHVFFGYAST